MISKLPSRGRSIRRALKRTATGLRRAGAAVLDVLPGFLADPLDRRLGKLVLGLQSVCSDWQLEAMRGLSCSRSLWLGHAAFVHALVLYLRPRVIVDLGVLQGCSTVAMALALKRLGRGVVYAVDTWEGDEDTGFYGPDVFDRFREEIQLLDLEQQVIPLKMRFEEAPGHITEPVDLLHVDGFHTFRAARSDFRLFRPQLRPGSVALFHDVYNWNFGEMLLLWRLLALRYRSYRIKHSSGLGIVLIPGGDRTLGLPANDNVLEHYQVIRQRMFSGTRERPASHDENRDRFDGSRHLTNI
jgi:Methyltransferase domain